VNDYFKKIATVDKDRRRFVAAVDLQRNQLDEAQCQVISEALSKENKISHLFLPEIGIDPNIAEKLIAVSADPRTKIEIK
jgi:hypothetical protein